jgi:hypothetical protein
LAAVAAIAVAGAVSEGTLLYEFRLPLARSNDSPYGVAHRQIDRSVSDSARPNLTRRKWILSAAAASAVVEAGFGAELADAADSVAVGVEETWVTCVEPVPCRR